MSNLLINFSADVVTKRNRCREKRSKWEVDTVRLSQIRLPHKTQEHEGTQVRGYGGTTVIQQWESVGTRAINDAGLRTEG